MLKEKDIIIARENFMKENPHYVSRKFIVNKFDGVLIKLTNYEDESQFYHGWFNTEEFFLFNDVNINRDIREALDRYEFKSFQGVTVEGKIIQLDLPVPFVRSK